MATAIKHKGRRKARLARNKYCTDLRHRSILARYSFAIHWCKEQARSIRDLSGFCPFLYLSALLLIDCWEDCPPRLSSQAEWNLFAEYATPPQLGYVSNAIQFAIVPLGVRKSTGHPISYYALNATTTISDLPLRIDERSSSGIARNCPGSSGSSA